VELPRGGKSVIMLLVDQKRLVKVASLIDVALEGLARMVGKKVKTGANTRPRNWRYLGRGAVLMSVVCFGLTSTANAQFASGTITPFDEVNLVQSQVGPLFGVPTISITVNNGNFTPFNQEPFRQSEFNTDVYLLNSNTVVPLVGGGSFVAPANSWVYVYEAVVGNPVFPPGQNSALQDVQLNRDSLTNPGPITAIPEIYRAGWSNVSPLTGAVPLGADWQTANFPTFFETQAVEFDHDASDQILAGETGLFFLFASDLTTPWFIGDYSSNGTAGLDGGSWIGSQAINEIPSYVPVIIPEPATLGLLCLGGMALKRRRR
jgi:hypothetical protein